jgi:hypothetical protein
MATLLLVSLSLGLSNFAAAVGIGLTGADSPVCASSEVTVTA